jgi:hypothetical protein
MHRIDGGELREWRRSLGWDVPEMARQLRRAAAGKHMPAHDSLIRQIRRWERSGTHEISERYELLYRGLGLPADRWPDELGVQVTVPETAVRSTSLPAWAVRLREERCRRGWTKGQMALRISRAGDERTRAGLPDAEHIVRRITGYEAGAHLPGEQYAELYSRALGIPRAVLFGAGGGEQDVLPRAADADGLVSWITSSNTTDEAIERIGQSALDLAGAHTSQPPRTVLNDVMQAHRQVQALLHSGRQRLRQTRDLLRIDADLLAHASLLLDDLHHGSSAEAHGHAALQLAEEAGASKALAFSAQAKTARWRGMHSRGGPASRRYFASSAGLARQGFDRCGPADPVRVLLACQEASAAALLGDAPLARQALRRAEHAAETAPSGEATAWSCPHPRLALYGLSVALRLNDPAAALRSADTASQFWEAGEPCLFGVWSLVQAGTGIAHLMNGDLTAAASQLGLVTQLPADLRISTITGYLDDMDTQLRDRRFAAAPQAASMREQIAAFRAPARTGATS